MTELAKVCFIELAWIKVKGLITRMVKEDIIIIKGMFAAVKD